MAAVRRALTAVATLGACTYQPAVVEPFDPWGCLWDGDGRPAWLAEIGCEEDYAALAARPPDTSLPGASSTKFLIDRASLGPAGAACSPACETPTVCADDDGAAACREFQLYFQDTFTRPLHYSFATAYLSGTCACLPGCADDCGCDVDETCSAGCSCDQDCPCACASVARRCSLPPVADLGTFNRTEYLLPSRRFLLGAVTHYESPGLYALELAPVDTASLQMLERMLRQVARHVFFGQELYFLPTSVAHDKLAAELPPDIPTTTSAAIYGALEFQPLNLGEAIGRVKILEARDLATTWVSPRDIVVLDQVPNDINPVAGLITGEFQTPLAHVNILSQNRGTPNMGLRDAPSNETVRALDSRWARLTVEANAWSLVEVTPEEADAWWESRQPPQLDIPAIDYSVTDLIPLQSAGQQDTPAIGAKAAHVAELLEIEHRGADWRFDRAEELGRLPDGWTAASGVWAVATDLAATSGTAVLVQSAGGGPFVALAPRVWRNFVCRATVLSDDAGLALLYEESGAHVAARLAGTSLVLEAVDAGGSRRLLATTSLAGTGHSLVARVHDREVRLTATPLAGGPASEVQAILPAHSPGTSCGPLAGGAAIFDDFSLRPIFSPRGFAIPFYYFRQFMQANGFDDQFDALLTDPTFAADGKVRRDALAGLRADMVAAPLNASLAAQLAALLTTQFPEMRMRFRSSTNAEDLGTYAGAGLYTSRTGDPTDPTRPVPIAVKTVWASLFNQRAFEERELLGIDHHEVGMAILVHRAYPGELANGVAITANIFDRTAPAYYVNVQFGEVNVTNPQPGILPDQFLYYWAALTPAIAYLSYSTIGIGEPVMTDSEIAELGRALWEIHEHFRPWYGSRPRYAMDVELKLDWPDRALVIKQARPYPIE